MKYIRTKDRIVNLERKENGYTFSHYEDNEIKNGSYAGWYWHSEEWWYELECRDIDIIAQADTIEELCDEFVILSNDYPKYLNTISRNFSWIKKANGDDVVKAIYGAIWTDKGLIYVAKMNDKGELELL